jgi:hypothetical protein
MIKSQQMRMARHAVCMGDRRGAYSVLVGIPDGKRPLRRPRTKWKDNTKMNVQDLLRREIGWNDLSHKVRWRKLVNAVMNFQAS